MKTDLKRLLKAAAAAMVLLCGSPKAGAQWAVTDLPLLAQEITAWIDEIAAAGDQLAKLTESVEKYQAMIDKTKAIYNKIDPYIENGKKMYDIYRETERIAYDFKMLEEYIKRFGEGRMSASKVASLRMQATRLAKELEYIVKDIQEILNPLTNLTTKDRDSGVDNEKEKLVKIRQSMEKAIHDDALAMINAELEKSIETGTLAALGMLPTIEEEKKSDEAFSKVYKEAEDKILKSSGVTLNENDLYMTEGETNTTVDKVFDFVTAVIGTLAVLMLVWAFAIRTKGEQRHEDAMWKVFAGLIFVMLLLQVLKVTIFGVHGFDMTLPKF